MVERGDLIPPHPAQQGRQKDKQIARQHAGDDPLLLVTVAQLEQHRHAQRQGGTIEGAAAAKQHDGAAGKNEAGEHHHGGPVGIGQLVHVEQHPEGPDDGGDGGSDKELPLQHRQRRLV